MKTIIQYICCVCIIAASSLLTSCKDNIIEDANNQLIEHFELTVTQAAPTSSSRVSLGQDGLTTMWEPGDKLTLIDKKRVQAPIFLTTSIKENAASASFVAETGVPVGDYYVIYNYNTDMAYSHQTNCTTDQINGEDKLVLWGELTVTEGLSKASISLQHLYAKVRFEIKNFPTLNQDVMIGMYSRKKGFSDYKLFTEKGVVDAEYGTLNDSENKYSYIPSSKKFLNLRLFQTDYIYDTSELSQYSSLILPTDLRNDDIFFYIISGNTCYEFKKKGVNFESGTSYKVVLDYQKCDNETHINRPGDGSYEIKNAAEWRHIAYTDYIEGAVKLINDIDFSNDICLPVAAHVLNGNKHAIKNAVLDMPDLDYVGLIRHRNYTNEYSSRVYDLNLENVTIQGRNYVGALGGHNIEATNCKLIGESKVIGTGDYVGGFIGINGDNNISFLPLSSLYVGNNCLIQGKNYVGGILARMQASNTYGSSVQPMRSITLMEDCISKGTVKATGDYVGGLFGKMGPNDNFPNLDIQLQYGDYTFFLEKCINEGNVSGRNYVGGLGGELAIRNSDYSYSDRIALKHSYSNGNVSGENIVGGLLGRSYMTVNICYSRGTVKANQSTVGGLIGEIPQFTYLTNSYSLAEILAPLSTFKGVAGGLVGKTTGYTMPTEIRNCYFAGDNATGNGIVGESLGSTQVLNCVTTMPSLGTNLGTHDPLSGFNVDDVVKDSYAGVKSIKDKKSVINGDQAYSDTFWPLEINPAYCLKFADFSIDTNIPNFDEEVM